MVAEAIYDVSVTEYVCVEEVTEPNSSKVYDSTINFVLVDVTVPIRVTVGVEVHLSTEEQNEEAVFVLVNLEFIALTQFDTLATLVHVDAAASAEGVRSRKSKVSITIHHEVMVWPIPVIQKRNTVHRIFAVAVNKKDSDEFSSKGISAF